MTTVISCYSKHVPKLPAMKGPRRHVRTDSSLIGGSIHSSIASSGLAINNFDLLIDEQKSLVRSTQEALHQSLIRLQKASSNEEQDGAQFQVRSLISRAEELVITFQTVNKIRQEVGYIQHKLNEAKKHQIQAYDLIVRLRWLEKRLETLLLARRRGRPTGHKRRATHPMRVQAQAVSTMRENDSFSKSIGDSILSSTRNESLSDQHTKSTSHNQSPGHWHSINSSKQSPSPGSDVWHSESEANWTMITALKDITQSQVLSEDEQAEKFPLETSLTSYSDSKGGQKYMSEDKEEKIEVFNATCIGSSSAVVNGGFEHKRPLEVFGETSWNGLCLANNSNFVTADTLKCTVPNETHLSVLKSGLDELATEMESLQKLILSASASATLPGSLVWVRGGCHENTLPSLDKSTLTMIHQHPTAAVPEFLPSLVESVPSSGHPDYSKSFGGKLYPRPPRSWMKNLEPLPDVKLLWPMQMCAHNGAVSMRPHSAHKDLVQRGYNTHQDDIFEFEKCQKRCIEHLFKLLDSSLAETRIEAIQALGSLKNDNSEAIVQKLQCLQTGDSNFRVKFEATKALLSLGAVDNYTMEFVWSCLCLKITDHLDVPLSLLKLLCQDNVAPCLSVKDPNAPQSKALQEALNELLNSDDQEVSLYSALVFCHIKSQHHKSVCKLYEALNFTKPQHQSMALHYLIKYCERADLEVITCACHQMEKHSSWKLRLSAVEDLKHIGKVVLLHDIHGEPIFNFLVGRIVREPVLAVRVAIVELISDLDQKNEAESLFKGRLQSPNEVTRGEAVLALGSFEGLLPQTIQSLLDCLELDPSNYVRIQVIRVFAEMNIYHSQVVKCLSEKSRGSGMVARESILALQRLQKVHLRD